MNSARYLRQSASELTDAARRFEAAAQASDAYADAPQSLEDLEEALQVLSAAWYRLAADASPGIAQRQQERASGVSTWPDVDGLSREQEVRLMGTLHDVGAAFARCARACRHARSTATPLIARRLSATRADEQHQAEFSASDRLETAGQRAA